MINRTFSSIAVMVALGILTPIQAHAFGLGKLELSSALNEPFKAEIPVTALREDEQGNLQVRLATSSEFNRAGLERNFFLTKFTFTVVEKENGTVIEVSSVQPVKEPFVDFLITATTGEGRLLREYTVLLDPPETLFVKPEKTVTPTKVKTSSSAPSNKTTYQYPDGGYQPSSTTNYFSGSSYGPTKRDDTLWVIAQETKPASVSVHQMMIAILDANPNAFINNNINTLKIGQTLTIPSSDEIAKLSHSQAVARVAEQTAQWKNAAKVNVAAAQQGTDVISAQGDSVQPSSNTDENEDSARLQLVVADDTATGNDDLAPMGSDDLSKLRNQLTLAQETIEGQEQETIDFKARMDAMEEQLAIMRKIISVKDSDLARLQGMLGEDQQVDLASDELSDEMQAALEESGDAAISDEVDSETMVDQAEEMLEEIDATVDEMVDAADLMLEESEIDTSMDEEIAAAERMLDAEEAAALAPVLMVDEAAVAAAAAAAMEEAEFSGNAIYVAPNAETPVPVDTDLSLDESSAQLDDNFIDAEFAQARVYDEAAVADALAAARAEEEHRTGLIIDNELDFDSVMDVLDGEEDLPYPELAEDELAVEDELTAETELLADAENAETEAEAEASLIDKVVAFIATNKMNLLYGLGGLFVALLGWIFVRRRKQSDFEWVETDSLQDIDASDVEVADNVVEESVDSTHIDITDEAVEIDVEEEALTDTLSVDLTEETPEESIDDLLNQAEMSIAYGEYEQAHASVEKARQQDPTNQDVTLKLIALAYHQQQADEFSKLAAEIDIDKDSAAWLEVVEWGKDLVPDNPLFADSVTAVEDELSFDVDDASSDDNEITFDLDDSVTESESAEDDAKSLSTSDDTLSFDTDFDLESKAEDDEPSFDTTLTLDSEDDSAEITADVEPTDFDATVTLDTAADNDELTLETTLETDDADLELDLDEDLDLETELPDLEALAEESDEEISFDLDAPLTEEEPEALLDTIITDDVEELAVSVDDVEAPEDSVEELDVGADDLDFDMGNFDEVDEAETKLDLAAAYADMGDPDGAKNILDEVLKEGNADQKSRAQDLLNNLAK